MILGGPEITGNQMKFRKGMGLMNLVFMQGLSPGLEAMKEQRMSNSRGMAEERKSSQRSAAVVSFLAMVDQSLSHASSADCSGGTAPRCTMSTVREQSSNTVMATPELTGPE